LIQNGFSPDTLGQDKDNVLHKALRIKQYDLIKFCLQNGANLDLPDHNGVTPNQFAARARDKVLAKIFKDEGATELQSLHELRTRVEMLVFENQQIVNMLKNFLHYQKNVSLDAQHQFMSNPNNIIEESKVNDMPKESQISKLNNSPKTNVIETELSENNLNPYNFSYMRDDTPITGELANQQPSTYDAG
jgi:ankyrin repeat protein